MQTFDVLVVGGGSGLTVAHLAQEAGKRVAIVDDRALGGTCVNRGCIPSKTLIQAAEVVRVLRDAAAVGVHVDEKAVHVDFKAVMERMRRNRAAGRKGTEDWVRSVERFTWFPGRGRFVGDRTLEVGGERLRAERVFLAVGARPAVPPIPGLGEAGFLTNEDVFELEQQPRSLLVLGGGYIGAELSYFFSMLGTQVTVVEAKDCLLTEDHDVRHLFTQEFAKYVTLYNGHRAVAAGTHGGKKFLRIHPNGKEGEVREVNADALLVATGRRPNTDDLGLDQTGVRLDRNGFVDVDEHLRTSHPRIWATGDCNGRGMFKHTASREAHVAWQNSQGAAKRLDYGKNPHAIFTWPQVGSVGLTEEQARAQGLDVQVAKAAYDDIAKGGILGGPPGFAKLIAEKGTGRILGFHMAGPGAADLVHEVVVAMQCDGTVDGVLRATHIHPTMPELIEHVFTQVRPVQV